MNGPAKLSLAIALALTGGNAFALGLGTIQVKSRLNQPLEAVIPVIADSPAEASGLEVSLASAEDFQRVGLDRSRVDVPLEFSVATERGQTVIKVSTKDIVREPLVDFLIVANWPKGKLLREYTVLLDPPVTAPAAGAATLSPAHEAPRAKPQPLPPEHEHAAPKAAHVKPPRAENTQTKPAQTKPAQAKPAPKPVAEKPAPAPHAAGAGEYGPVAAGETLSEIAGATRPDDKTNFDAMMLALLKANPNAFYRDNINALKRGAILRIPSADEIKAGGNAAAVAAAVRDQNQAWASNAPVAKPTLVAKTGAPKSETAPTAAHKQAAAAGDSHLALVPPGAGKGKQNSSDRPGAATGTGNAQVTADLARTKEALASREQEVGELKSRVKDLEKIDGDNTRLLTLKQNEIAALQAKLKQLEATAAAKPAAVAVVAPAPAKPAEAKPAETKPAEVAAAKPGEAATAKEAAKLTAKDIWGDINASEKPGEAKPGATPAPATAAPPPAAKAPESTTPAAATTTPEPAEVKPTETKPAETKPASTPVAVKPKAPPKVEPISTPAMPWWQNNNVLMAGGAALLIIGLLALMRFMRKPKAALVPAAGMPVAHDEHLDAMAADEQHLLDQLAEHPGDAALSLQLLDLYYAHQDAAKFEAAAEAMYAHIADPTSAEWQQVRAMGEHLCPHNPLFGGNEDLGAALHDMHTATEHAEHDHMHMDDGHFDAGDFHTQQMPKPAEENFDFDLADHAASVHAEPAHAAPAPAYVPPPVPEPVRVATPASAPAAAKSNEDFFAGEDAIGTKLDLAKAYLDMGDPEGARSMLDEVLAEGNDAQKVEARKLLAEIG
ncbi:MAG TPA: FimV/HubP family polar landmark protein [Rudaea sp.]|nr:FimV/HubP family polar landmark protein [Rudaea sp.]